MKIAIVGSRIFPNIEAVRRYILTLPEGTTVISGGAEGVDSWAVAAAKYRGLKTEVYPANWRKFGKRAGALRNRIMVDKVDKVVAFWDTISKGTKITIDMAKESGKELEVIEQTFDYFVYTDGSGTTKGNPGGWAFVIIQNDRMVTAKSGGCPETTNNRMELTAALEGLNYVYKLKKPEEYVLLVSDSEYTIGIATRKFNAAKNQDLAHALSNSFALNKAKALHVRGHTGVVWNEVVDKAAGLERKKFL